MIHSRLIEQDFLDYVEKWRKIAQPLADWVLLITGVRPNRGCRRRFKSVARHLHPEVEQLLTGHGGNDHGVIAKVADRR